MWCSLTSCNSLLMTCDEAFIMLLLMEKVVMCWGLMSDNQVLIVSSSFGMTDKKALTLMNCFMISEVLYSLLIIHDLVRCGYLHHVYIIYEPKSNKSLKR